MDALQNCRMPILGIMLCFLFTIGTSQTAPNYMFIHEAATAPLRSYYDYIVVGGGTAGCPLATTLSQNASVLLLERGGSPYGNPNITNIAAMGRNLANTSPSSPSQRFVSEDGVPNNRPRVLGGGTSINAGFYSRGDAEFLVEAGLDWNEQLLNESYQWIENKMVFKPQPLINWQSAVRNGLLEVGVLPDNGFTYDHLHGTKIAGVTYDKDGIRRTAADLLQYANPSKITVLLHASAMKILFRTNENSGKLVASGVVFRDSSGTTHEAFLKEGSKNEVILSAGSIGSPQLLMLSGVGPEKHLKSQKIPVVLDQPLVGKGISDNPLNFVDVPARVPIGFSLGPVVGITPVGSYIEPFSSMYADVKATVSIGSIASKIIGPLSSGHLELRNRNPDDNPSITFNYFHDPKDLERCVNSMNIIRKLIESRSLSEIKSGEQPFSVLLNLTASSSPNLRPKHENTSTSLEQYCMDTVITISHYHGGCQIGKVVDKDYKVMGLDSLRVVDGSIFLNSPGTNPQATLLMLGRYVGVKILKERFSNTVQNTGGFCWLDPDLMDLKLSEI